MCRGKASKIIETVITRQQEGLATPKQVRTLTKFGFNKVNLWTMDEAKAVIAQLAAAGWKPWMANIVPGYYLPKRLREVI